MLFHRWETISHIISDTKLIWFQRAQVYEDNEYDFASEPEIGIRKTMYLLNS